MVAAFIVLILRFGYQYEFRTLCLRIERQSVLQLSKF